MVVINVNDEKFGFVRREEKKNIKNVRENKSGVFFSLAFFIMFILPLFINLLISSFIPITVYNAIEDKDNYVEIEAYRGNSCKFYNRNCVYYYTVKGETYPFDSNEIGFKLKTINIFYDETKPYDSVKSMHNSTYYLLNLIPFLAIILIIFIMHKIIIKNKNMKENRVKFK